MINNNMKKRIFLGILGILLIPFVSGFINPDEKLYSTGELATAVVGNNIFFGAIVVVGLILLGYYVWVLMRKGKK